VAEICRINNGGNPGLVNADLTKYVYAASTAGEHKEWHADFNTAGPWAKAGRVLPKDWPPWMRKFKDY